MTRAIPDVVIVGAGMAGTTAAIVLGRLGAQVTLIDQRLRQPPVFRAEKMEPDQAEIMRDLGLLDAIAPVSRRIRHVAKAYRGRVLRIAEVEQYGFFYQDLVNVLRHQLPAAVTLRIERVNRLQSAAGGPQAVLSDGSLVAGRLLVLATGTAGGLHKDLGLERTVLSSGHSICLGFTLSPTRFPHDVESVTYYANGAHRIGYISLFPVPEGVRANMFAYWDPTDPLVEELRNGGLEVLHRLLPGLARVTGPLALASKIEARTIDLYRVEDVVQEGVVLIGDAFQSVCPSTGTGLSKVLVDVKTLQRRVPTWLTTPGMGPEKTGQFYADEHKRATDTDSLRGAEYQRWLGTAVSFRSRVHRVMEVIRMRTG